MNEQVRRAQLAGIMNEVISMVDGAQDTRQYPDVDQYVSRIEGLYERDTDTAQAITEARARLRQYVVDLGYPASADQIMEEILELLRLW